ncbi:MAG: hypothetical protein GC136_00930 [Alphaproteobacteria bacterium]|nr:hypothetical protein [Alphaproteobacteria bacterium]
MSYLVESALRETAALFDNPRKLESGLNDLENNKISRQDINILDVRKRGRFVQAANNSSPEYPVYPAQITPARSEERNLGSTFFIGIIAYAFGLVGALIAHTISPMELVAFITMGNIGGMVIGIALLALMGRFTPRTIYRGKPPEEKDLILLVNTQDPEKENLVNEIIRKRGGKPVYVHTLS